MHKNSDLFLKKSRLGMLLKSFENAGRKKPKTSSVADNYLLRLEEGLKV